MSIVSHPGDGAYMPVRTPESMIRTIMEMGIVPFFINPVAGYSIQELTPGELWFNDDDMGPWDWKIEAVRSGDIAYGKFLGGGKSSFASVEYYKHLMNYRRSLEKYAPEGIAAETLEEIRRNGSGTIRELRQKFGLRKNQMESVLTRLEMGTWIVVGDFQRVYRGADLHYSGWQLTSYCTPDELFGGDEPGFSFGPFKGERRTLDAGCSPEESYEVLRRRIVALAPMAGAKQVERLLR